VIFSNECRENKKSNYQYFSKVELDLMLTYWNTLIYNGVDKNEYPFELFEQQYITNIIYFTIFCIRQKYSVMTPEDIEKFKSRNIDGLHLRSRSHIEQLLDRCNTLIDVLNIQILKSYEK